MMAGMKNLKAVDKIKVLKENDLDAVKVSENKYYCFILTVVKIDSERYKYKVWLQYITVRKLSVILSVLGSSSASVDYTNSFVGDLLRPDWVSSSRTKVLQIYQL